jgi:hypothetical protein
MSMNMELKLTQELERTPAQMIERYIYLRNERTKADATFAAFRKEEFDAPMQELHDALLDQLNRMGSESIKSKVGTAFKQLNTSVTTADGAEFRRHIIGLEAWDLVDWRPNKTAVNDLVAAGEPLPPGINRATFFTVKVRSPEDRS